jgi:paraquat-inducible protein A
MPVEDSLRPIVVACPDCDLINQVPALAPSESAACVRCDASLSRNPVNSLQRGIALTCTAIVLYIIACTFPFLSFGMSGIVAHTRMFSGIIGLYEQGMYFLAVAVSFTIVIVPVFTLTSLTYLLVPLGFNTRLPGAARVLRWVQRLEPWNMVEIFLIGIIVSGVKLQKMAALEPGLAAWAFIVLIFIMAAISLVLEPRVLWERLERARCLPPTRT